MENVLKYRVKSLLLFGPIFLICIFISVHTDTEDAYRYSTEVLRANNFNDVYHASHPLYHFIHRALFLLTRIEPFYLGLLISLSCSLATLAILYKLLRKFELSLENRFFTLSIIAFSFGFWRYSWAVEANSMSWLIQSIFIYLLFDSRNLNFRLALGIGLLLSLGALIHNSLLIVSLPILFTYCVLKKRFKFLAFSLASLLLVFTPIHLSLSKMNGTQRNQVRFISLDETKSKQGKQNQLKKKSLSLSNIPKSAVGLSSAIIGNELIFTIEPIYDTLQNKLFPKRFLKEERFLALNTPIIITILWASFLITLTISFLLGIKQVFTSTKMKEFPSGRRMEFLSLLVASLTGSVFLFWFEPGNPEMWSLFLPIILLTGSLCFYKISSNLKSIIVFSLVGTNLFGGIIPKSLTRNDYYYHSINQFIEKANEGDLFLVGVRRHNMPRYFHYKKPIYCINRSKISKTQETVFFEKLGTFADENKNIFVHETFIKKHPELLSKLPEYNLSFTPTSNSHGGGVIQYLINH